MKQMSVFILSVLFSGMASGQTNIKLDEISEHTGDSVTVCGLVADLRYFENAKNQPTLLNIGAAFPDNKLTAVIWGDVRKEFKQPVDDFKGKQVCITGKITIFKDKPQIVIEKLEQIVIQ